MVRVEPNSFMRALGGVLVQDADFTSVAPLVGALAGARSNNQCNVVVLLLLLPLLLRC